MTDFERLIGALVGSEVEFTTRRYDEDGNYDEDTHVVTRQFLDRELIQ